MQDKIVDVILKEYEILRKEIDEYHKQQKDSMNFALISIGIFLSFSTFLFSEGRKDILKFHLLIFPIIVSFFGFFYLDRTVRIKRIASYIHNFLRPLLIEIIEYDVFHWEIYKKVTSQHKEVNFIIARFLDWMRIFIFTFPSIISLISYFSIVGISNNLSFGEIIFLLVNIINIAILILVNNMIEETKGADIELDFLIKEIVSISEKERKNIFKSNR